MPGEMNVEPGDRRYPFAAFGDTSSNQQPNLGYDPADPGVAVPAKRVDHDPLAVARVVDGLVKSGDWYIPQDPWKEHTKQTGQTQSHQGDK